MGCVLEWLASVALGVAAVPFLGFAHFDTDGEGLGQRTHYGYGFMLQSFIRPILLVLGFILATAMIEISVRFLSITFGFAVHDAQVHSFTGLFSMLGYCALYMVVAVGLINTSCSLMHLIPDAIMNFMGVQSVGMGFGHETMRNAMPSALGGAGGLFSAQAFDMRTKREEKEKKSNDTTGGGGVSGKTNEEQPPK